MNEYYSILNVSCPKYRSPDICIFYDCKNDRIDEFCPEHTPKKLFLNYCSYHGRPETDCKKQFEYESIL